MRRGVRALLCVEVIGDILQPTHLLFILVIALIVLGPKKLPEVGRSLGKGLRDFRSALRENDPRTELADLRQDMAPMSTVQPVTAQPVPAQPVITAQTLPAPQPAPQPPAEQPAPEPVSASTAPSDPPEHSS